MKQDQEDTKDGRREDRESREPPESNVESDPAPQDGRLEARASSPSDGGRDATPGDEPGYGYGV